MVNHNTKAALRIQMLVGTIALCFACQEANHSADGGPDSQVDGDATPTYTKCLVDQPEPYLDSPYPGIHGNAGNSERIPCDGPEKAPEQGWHALRDHMIFNPATVGLDRVYAVVAHTSECQLWYVDLDDGEEHCLPRNPEVLSFGVLGGSPELDQDGNVYVTDGWDSEPDAMLSFAPGGELRWRRTFEGLRASEPERYQPPLGLHFVSPNYAATVTPDGLVVLLSMDDGEVLDTFTITEETNLAPLPPTPLPIPDELPSYLECRLANVLGEGLSPHDLMTALAGGTGGSGSYTDNSIGGSEDLLFVVGGGPDNGSGQSDNGALVALRIDETSGSPALQLHWYMETNGATGSSPTIDTSGRYVVISDVTSEGRARLVVADIAACEAVAGSSTPACAPAWTHTIDGGPLNASVSMDEDGVVYAWNQGPDPEGVSPMPELVAVAGPDEHSSSPRVLWQASFPPLSPGRWTSSEWSSTALVLDNMIVGTITHLVAAPMEGLEVPIPIPLRTEHELVGVRRSDGEILWRGVPIDDDSINSPLLGPDGNIYVPIFGMLDFAHIPSSGIGGSCDDFVEEDYQGGLVQFLSSEN